MVTRQWGDGPCGWRPWWVGGSGVRLLEAWAEMCWALEKGCRSVTGWCGKESHILQIPIRTKVQDRMEGSETVTQERCWEPRFLWWMFPWEKKGAFIYKKASMAFHNGRNWGTYLDSSSEQMGSGTTSEARESDLVWASSGVWSSSSPHETKGKPNYNAEDCFGQWNRSVGYYNGG